MGQMHYEYDIRKEIEELEKKAQQLDKLHTGSIIPDVISGAIIWLKWVLGE